MHSFFGIPVVRISIPPELASEAALLSYLGMSSRELKKIWWFRGRMYHQFEIAKGKDKTRIISAPDERLKYLQRQIAPLLDQLWQNGYRRARPQPAAARPAQHACAGTSAGGIWGYRASEHARCNDKAVRRSDAGRRLLPCRSRAPWRSTPGLEPEGSEKRVHLRVFMVVRALACRH